MRFPKLVFGLCFIWLLVSCGEDTSSVSNSSENQVTNSETQVSETVNNDAGQSLSESPERKKPSGTFCYGFNDQYVSIWGRVEIDDRQNVTGELHTSNYSAETDYSAYAAQEFSGTLEDETLDLVVTTTIEGSTAIADETWFFRLRELETTVDLLSLIGCNEYADQFAYFEANPPWDLLSTFDENESDFVEDDFALDTYCDPNDSVFVIAETENFWLNICGGDLPHTYVGVSKDTGDALRLGLSYYEEDGSYFEAVNGDYTYSIIFETAKGSFLSVTKGDEQIVQEPLTSW